MKTVKAILTLATLLTLANAAQARTTCAFGESTADLFEELESSASGKIFYKGDRLDLTRAERIGGLTALEKEMITLTASRWTEKPVTFKEAAQDFVAGDGYIQYFSPNAQRRTFVVVAANPGDNEYGQIFEITQNGSSPRLVTVALIGDSDLYDCTVAKGTVH